MEDSTRRGEGSDDRGAKGGSGADQAVGRRSTEGNGGSSRKVYGPALDVGRQLSGESGRYKGMREWSVYGAIRESGAVQSDAGKSESVSGRDCKEHRGKPVPEKRRAGRTAAEWRPCRPDGLYHAGRDVGRYRAGDCGPEAWGRGDHPEEILRRNDGTGNCAVDGPAVRDSEEASPADTPEATKAADGTDYSWRADSDDGVCVHDAAVFWNRAWLRREHRPEIAGIRAGEFPGAL